MRGLSQIELLQTKDSKTGLLAVTNKRGIISFTSSVLGWAAKLGPGATWDKVLEMIPPDKWTIVHGQCLGVGVGGFTLGGGVNMVGSTARYGAAMEQVIEYEMVTAQGEVVRVNEDNVEMLQKDGSWSGLDTDDPRYDTDILFGLRGAGASFGVVTQFLVTVYPSPETLASVIPVYVSGEQDLARIQTLAHTDQGRGYQFGLYSLYYPMAVRQGSLLDQNKVMLQISLVASCAGHVSVHVETPVLVGGGGGCAHGAQCGRHQVHSRQEHQHYPGHQHADRGWGQAGHLLSHCS